MYDNVISVIKENMCNVNSLKENGSENHVYYLEVPKYPCLQIIYPSINSRLNNTFPYFFQQMLVMPFIETKCGSFF